MARLLPMFVLLLIAALWPLAHAASAPATGPRPGPPASSPGAGPAAPAPGTSIPPGPSLPGPGSGSPPAPDAGAIQRGGPTIGGLGPSPAPAPDGGVPLQGGPTIGGLGPGSAPAPDAGAAAPVPPSGPAPPSGPGPGSAPPTDKPEEGLKQGWAPHAGAVIDLGGQKRVFVGDTFTVRITVISRASVNVNLPASLALGEFSLVGRGPQSSEKLDGDKVRYSFSLKVAAFSVGELELPAIPVTYVAPREAFTKPPDPGQPLPALVVTTPPLRQRISSVLANEPQPQLKKNAPPMTILVEDRRMRTILIVLVALLLGAAIGFVIFWLLRNRRRRLPPPLPPRPADEVALEKLAALRAAGLLERGEMKELHLGISEAIRDYLGNRYGFDSLEMTTTELAEQMQKVPLTGLHLHELVHFLQDCDLVKFAKYIPPLTEAERTLAEAEHIVRVTRFVPSVTEDASEEGAPPGSGASPAEPSPPPAKETRNG